MSVVNFGISKQDRIDLENYCKRFLLTDASFSYLKKSANNGKGRGRSLYAFVTDSDDIDYKIHIDKIRQKRYKPSYKEALDKKAKFKVDAMKIHGDKFDYSLLPDNPTKRDTVTILCKKHGEFKQLAWNHINGKRGCMKCHLEKRKKMLNFV